MGGCGVSPIMAFACALSQIHPAATTPDEVVAHHGLHRDWCKGGQDSATDIPLQKNLPVCAFVQRPKIGTSSNSVYRTLWLSETVNFCADFHSRNVQPHL